VHCHNWPESNFLRIETTIKIKGLFEDIDVKNKINVYNSFTMQDQNKDNQAAENLRKKIGSERLRMFKRYLIQEIVFSADFESRRLIRKNDFAYDVNNCTLRHF
jgi:hypothetical protein